MHVRLEKIIPAKRQQRFYVVSIGQTLFGEWFVRREWGRIGAPGGQQMAEYLPTRTEAEEVLQRYKLAKCRRGYAPLPVQLELF